MKKFLLTVITTMTVFFCISQTNSNSRVDSLVCIPVKQAIKAIQTNEKYKILLREDSAKSVLIDSLEAAQTVADKVIQKYEKSDSLATKIIGDLKTALLHSEQNSALKSIDLKGKDKTISYLRKTNVKIIGLSISIIGALTYVAFSR